MTQNLKIDYIEFYSSQMDATQGFFSKAFGWEFVDYGPDYRDIRNAGTGGGLDRGDTKAPLIILRTDDLQAAYDQVVAAGAQITRDIYDFPGGSRFEFCEPGGTAMGVWSTN